MKAEKLQRACAEMYLRQKCPVTYAKQKKKVYQEGVSFRRMGRFLASEQRALNEERYVTAMYGCRTNWQLIEAAGKYFHYSTKRSVPRVDRPNNGASWRFKKQFGQFIPLKKAA